MRSTDLKRNLHLLEDADLVLAMTEEQKAIVARIPQAAGKRLATLKEYAGDAGDIADPATKDGSVFDETCRTIKSCLERALPRMISEGAGGSS